MLISAALSVLSAVAAALMIRGDIRAAQKQ
jgi:hypothetical protein